MNWNNRPNNQVYHQKPQYTTPPAATYQPATHQPATYQPATHQQATYQPTKPYQPTTAYQQARYKQTAYQGNTFNNAYKASPAVPLTTRVGSMAPSVNQQKYVVLQQPHGSSGVPNAVPIKNNTYNYNIPNQNFASPTNLQTNVNRQASSQVYVPPLNNNTSNSFMPNNLNLETSSGARPYSTYVTLFYTMLLDPSTMFPVPLVPTILFPSLKTMIRIPVPIQTASPSLLTIESRIIRFHLPSPMPPIHESLRI